MTPLVFIAALLPVEPGAVDERPEPEVASLTAVTVAVAAVLSASPVADAYRRAVDTLSAQRKGLAAQKAGKERTQKARDALLTAFDQQLFPAWEGTPWNFYGTTETPREGTIACGYYVTTLLRDAGFKLERVKLAQAASERLVQAFASEDELQRFRNVEVPKVIAAVRAKHGPGLFIVGMDLHVGLLRITEAGAKLCHSAVLKPEHATCEDAETSPGLVSQYHVIGPVLSDARVRDWLEQRDVRR